MPSPPKSELRVPKQAVTVELALAGEDSRPMELFLARQHARDAGPENVLELLDAAQAFVPARDLAADALVLVARDAIALVTVPREAAGLDGELYDERRAVRIELAGGRALDGEMLYSPAEGRARLVDHLNDASGFLRVFTGDRVTLVGKRHVRRVLERES